MANKQLKEENLYFSNCTNCDDESVIDNKLIDGFIEDDLPTDDNNIEIQGHHGGPLSADKNKDCGAGSDCKDPFDTDDPTLYKPLRYTCYKPGHPNLCEFCAFELDRCPLHSTSGLVVNPDQYTPQNTKVS